MLGGMDPLQARSLATSAGEFTIGAGDLDARAQGVALCRKGAPIRGFRVLSGSGALAYVDDVTGAVCQLGNVVALQPGDEITPEWGIRIRSVHGTSNAVPSAALSLRAVW